MSFYRLRRVAFCLALLAVAAPSELRAGKIGMVFNGGGGLMESATGKDEQMTAEVQDYVRLLQRKGYDMEGNVFHRDGRAPVLGIAARAAYPREFISRLQKQCMALQSGDKMVIAFSGHGNLEAASGGQPKTQTIIPYRHARPRDPATLDLSRFPEAQVRDMLSAARDLVALKLNMLETLNSEAADPVSVNARNDALVDRILRHSPQARRNDIGTMLTRVALEFDFVRVSRAEDKDSAIEELSRDIAPYMLLAAAQSDFSRAFFCKHYICEDLAISEHAGSGEGRGLPSLREVIQANCLRGAGGEEKAVAIRLIGAQCYSGGLLELTTPDGRVCAVSKTNPYNPSIYAKGTPTMCSSGECLSDIRCRMSGLCGPREANNDPLDSMDWLIARWLADAQASCRPEPGSEHRVVTMDERFRAKFCASVGPGLPGNYKINQNFVPSPEEERDEAKMDAYMRRKDQHRQQLPPDSIYEMAGLSAQERGLQRKDVYRKLFEKIASGPYKAQAAPLQRCIDDPF